MNQRSPPARAPQSALPDHTPDLDNGRTNILVSEELWPHLRDATVAAATRMTGAARPLPAVAGRSINHTSRDDAVGSVSDIPEVTFCRTLLHLPMLPVRRRKQTSGERKRRQPFLTGASSQSGMQLASSTLSTLHWRSVSAELSIISAPIIRRLRK